MRESRLLALRHAVLSSVTCLALFAPFGPAHAESYDEEEGSPFRLDGHLKARLVGTRVPGDSVFRDLVGSGMLDSTLQSRLRFGATAQRFDFAIDYQLAVTNGETNELAGQPLAQGNNILFGRLNDDRRLFDLTEVITDDEDTIFLHRADRLSVGYTGDRGVVRFGRHAVTWGNGLLYSPMDIFNPFDPATVDKEFKSGDDMLYGQFLRDNGDDVQAVIVFRREIESGDVEADEGSAAVKYHAFGSDAELDVLVAAHYGELLLGGGWSRSFGGAVWRGDLMVAMDGHRARITGVANATYSWVLFDKNWSGLMEYFYNGFGEPGNRYDLEGLADNRPLTDRLARGELFTVGRHYVGAGALVELTPLLRLSSNLFANALDPSGLIQLVADVNLGQNLVLLAAANVPFGADGTEFGGLDTPVPGKQLASGESVFVQVAWYF